MRTFAVLTALVLVACGEPPLTPSPSTPESANASTTTLSTIEATPSTGGPGEAVPPTTDPTAVTGEVPWSLLSEVTADAASRSGIAARDITVTRAEEVIWPDGSLGCPEPGQFYTQATEPGYWIELEAAGENYDYRATESGFFKLCEATVPSLSPPGGDDGTGGPPTR